MKRYEYLIIAALVLLFFLMCLPVPGLAVPHRTRAGRRQRAQPQCNQDKRSFWLRNSCQDGLLTVVKNRPLVQVTGLHQDHPSAEILKESCFMPGASWDDRLQDDGVGPYVRYQHKKSKKYICFNKQGKLRTMNEAKAQRKGRLCMFVEEAEGETGEVYHRLRSAFNSKWYLGFNPKRTTHVLGGQFRASLPRLGGKGFGPRRCDFKFFSGLHNRTDIKNDWKGIFDLLGDMDTKDSSSKITKNTKAALEHTQILDNSLNLKEASRSQNNDLNTIETDSVIIGKNSDKSVASSSAGTKKISSLYHEKLQMQQFLLRAKQHKKIRHFKHKRPRLQKQRQRRPRLQVKNQRLRNKSSPIGQKIQMKKRGQAVKKVSRPSRRRPRV